MAGINCERVEHKELLKFKCKHTQKKDTKYEIILLYKMISETFITKYSFIKI